MILQALSGAVGDKSIPVRKSFAAAVGYTAKFATEKAFGRFITHMKKMYIENDNEDVRSIPGIVFSECAKNANDATKPFSADILPLAFFGSRDENEEGKTVWKTVWEDLMGGASNNATKMYSKEIVELACQIVGDSPSWPIKKQVGKTFFDLSEILGTSFEKYMPTVVPVLIDALGGRTWEGKEAVLQALTTACVLCKDWVGKNTEVRDEVVKVGIREMRKNNKAYKRFGLEYVGEMVDALGGVDVFGDVKDYLYEIAGGEDDVLEVGEPMDIEEMRARPMNLVIQCNAMKALGRFWPMGESATHLKYGKEIAVFLTKNIDGNVWNVRLGVLDAINAVAKKAELAKCLHRDEIKALLMASFSTLYDIKYVAVRTAGVAAVKSIFDGAGVKGVLGDSVINDLKKTLSVLTEGEKMPVIAEDMKVLLESL